jgi:hypothetical protein
MDHQDVPTIEIVIGTEAEIEEIEEIETDEAIRTMVVVTQIMAVIGIMIVATVVTEIMTEAGIEVLPIDDLNVSAAQIEGVTMVVTIEIDETMIARDETDPEMLINNEYVYRYCK